MAQERPTLNAAVPFAGALASLVVFPFLGTFEPASAAPFSTPIEAAAAHDDAAAAPTPDEAPARLAANAAPPPATAAPSATEAVRVSVYARDLVTREVVADGQNAAQKLGRAGPKVAVLTAALHLLGPEYRFKTRYYARGRVKDGVLWGDLLVRGMGDPTVDDVRLRWLTRQMALSGLTRITGRVVLDDSALAAPEPEEEPEDEGEEGEGAASADEGDAGVDEEPPPAAPPDEEEEPLDSTPTGPAAFHFENDVVTLTVRPDKVGAPAEVILHPNVGFARVAGSVMTGEFDRRPRAVATFGPRGGSVLVGGVIGESSPPRRFLFKVDDPRFFYGRALVTHLKRNEIQVSSNLSVTPGPGRRRRMFVDVSPPFAELAEAALHAEGDARGQSIVDATLRVLAVEVDGVEGRRQNGLKVVERFLEGEARAEAPFAFAKSESPTLTTRQVVDVLAWAHARYEVKAEVLRGLGPASTHPLLRHTLKSRALLGKLRATVEARGDALELAGFVEGKNGHPLAFAMRLESRGKNADALWKEAEARLLALSGVSADVETNLQKPAEKPREAKIEGR